MELFEATKRNFDKELFEILKKNDYLYYHSISKPKLNKYKDKLLELPCKICDCSDLKEKTLSLFYSILHDEDWDTEDLKDLQFECHKRTGIWPSTYCEFCGRETINKFWLAYYEDYPASNLTLLFTTKDIFKNLKFATKDLGILGCCALMGVIYITEHKK